MPRFDVTMDSAQVRALLGPDFERQCGEALEAAALRAVNAVADRTYREARSRITERINLPALYVDQNLTLTLATDPRRARASIRARGLNTTLARFAPQAVRAPAKGRSRGNPRHGIPAGQKLAGMTVEVLRGTRKFMPGAFLMTLRSGQAAGAGRLGLFVRHRDGSLEHKYGPSVWQLFRVAANGMTPDVEMWLARELTIVGREELMRALS